MISAYNALLILRKWQREAYPLRLAMAGEGFRVGFNGRICEVGDTELAFLMDEPNVLAGEASIELANCRFEYGESREARPGFSAILTIVRPDGTAFMFGEIRP